MIYYLTRSLSILLLKLFFRFEVRGEGQVPPQGGVILASNHQSFIDPLLVGCGTTKRPVHFMARESLFRGLWGWYLSRLNSFPVKRGGADRGAWRHFEELVASGKLVSFFPEGTRSPDGNLQKANAGSGMLIHRCKGAVVVPARVFGTFDVMPRHKFFGGFHKVGVAYGPPLDLDEEFSREGSREVYEAISDKIMAAIAKLSLQSGEQPAPEGAAKNQ